MLSNHWAIVILKLDTLTEFSISLCMYVSVYIFYLSLRFYIRTSDLSCNIAYLTLFLWVWSNLNKKLRATKGFVFFICLIKFLFSNSMKVFNHTHNVRLHITGKERVNPMSCILLEKNCSEMSLVLIWIKLSSNVSSTFPLAFIPVANGIQFCFILSYRNLFLIFKKSIWTSVTIFYNFAFVWMVACKE